jgi:nucleoside-diphosphate-sugar epimerase
MRLFLTGATGFIGSHVLSAAFAAGHEVIALRRDPRNTSSVSLTCQPEWFDGCLASLEYCHLQNIDTVVHLAAAGVSPKHASWGTLLEINVTLALRLMELVAAAGVKRVVVVGTCHEYGSAALRYHAIPPEAPLEPLNPYGASKAAAFQLIRTFSKQQGMELFYGRLFSVYGEGQFQGNFWPSLHRAAKAGEDFRMTSGRQISDFIPVTCAADHILAACTRSDITAGIPLVVNIGTGKSSSLLEFAEAEWRRLGAIGQLLPGALSDRPDQIYHMVPDLRGLYIPAKSLS